MPTRQCRCKHGATVSHKPIAWRRRQALLLLGKNKAEIERVPIENCPNCGKVFAKTNRDICPACWEIEQTLVDQIADYLHRRPAATSDEVLKDLGVPRAELVRILRRGRLKGYDQLAPLLVCERCGAPADRGTFCANCRNVVLQLTEVPPEEPVEEDFMAHRERQRPPAPKPHAPSVEHPNSQDPPNRPRQDFWRDRAR